MSEFPSLDGLCAWAAPLALPIALAACSSEDVTSLYDPRVGALEARPAPYLNFPSDARRAPTSEAELQSNFPRLLSETGAFRDLVTLDPAPGLVPYSLQAPLWSDGADKHRWIALPELGSVVASDDAPWGFPAGTVFVKHFEMALDQREPAARRRLETRLLVAAQRGSFYGVTYRWNAEETDAEIVLDAETEQLSLVDAEGAVGEQPWFYPGPRDCNTCHTPNGGFVLGLRTRQLNQEFDYGSGRPAINQLLAWSAWGLLDRVFSERDVEAAPRLANVSDDSESLEKRVRSYWDSNCSMCHAGAAGNVTGWDARFFIPLEDQGLDQPPQMVTPGAPSVLLVPGDPEGSYIYTRSATVETALRMPPVARNLVDQTYLDVLARWIDSL